MNIINKNIKKNTKKFHQPKKEAKMLEVPESWFKSLLKIAKQVEEATTEEDKSKFCQLLGYISSAKVIIKYNK